MKTALMALLLASLAVPATSFATSVESSAAIQQDIAGVSPQAASVAAPAFAGVDSLRSSFAGLLDSQIAAARQKVAAAPKPDIVAGAATQDAQIQNPTDGFWYWLYLIYLYALQAVRWLVGNAAAFYAVLVLAFLYLIYRLFRLFRRPY